MLPARGKVRRVVHHAALPFAEMPAFMADLRERPGVGARALEFAILTAARSGEVRGLRWREIDLDRAMWTVPGERMKGGREHVAEAALAHAVGDRTEAAYRRGDALEKRRAMMAAWAEFYGSAGE